MQVSISLTLKSKGLTPEHLDVEHIFSSVSIMNDVFSFFSLFFFIITICCLKFYINNTLSNTDGTLQSDIDTSKETRVM